MVCDKLDAEISDDSDDERDTKHNLLDVEEVVNDMIEEEDEGAECDDCCHHNPLENHGDCDSSDELPLIVERGRL